MNKLVIGICAALLSCCTTLAEQSQHKPHQCPSALDEDGVEALSHFAGIIGNFIGIVQAPSNPVNVGSNIAGIVQGVTNLLSIVTRSGKTLEELIQTPEFQRQCALLISTKTHGLAGHLEQI